MKSLTLCIAAALVGMCGPIWGADLGPVAEFHGACDGSALVALDESHFAVACDDDNILRIYQRTQTNAPVWQHDFSGFLQLAHTSSETDIEGAARIGDVIYWISSHSRNAAGREHLDRQRFFATRIVRTGSGFELEPLGQPCRNLLAALLAEPRLASFHLDDAAQRAPELEGALNIEGLAATPAGGLLIAFRNPVPGGRALLVPLENPAEVIQGRVPRFGVPVQLDLGGRGVRDITLAGGRYFLIAGGVGGKGKFNLFEWGGPGSKPNLKRVKFGKLKPEGLAVIGTGNALELLCSSDDSSRPMGDCDCKDLKDAAQRAFRLVVLRP